MPTRSLANVIPPDDEPADDSGSQTSETTADATPVETNTTAVKEEKVAAARKAPTRSTSTRKSSRSTGSAAEPQTGGAEQRAGRPRIPKTGPVTRVTVDLAVTEQRAIDQLAARIGREIDRGRGKNKIYPQHLMRVAIRRLLTDEAFRQEVTADLQEGRDTLKRPQR